MYPKKLFNQLFPTYILMAAIPIILTAALVLSSLKGFYTRQSGSNLKSKAFLVSELVKNDISDPSMYHSIDSLCKIIGKNTSTRVTIILPNGVVIADSDRDVNSMENHLERPEIRTALSGIAGSSTRFSTTVEQKMLYVSIPLIKNDNIQAVIRTAVPLTSITGQLNSITLQLIAIAAFLFIISIFFSMMLSKKIAKPIQNLREGAEHFAHGDLNFKLPVPESEELNGLTETLNRMAKQLNDRIQTIINQGNEQQTILKSMSEGVIAVDISDKIIILNQAAAEMLKINISEATGKPIQEVIRISELHRCIEKALKSPIPVERDVVLLTDKTEEQFIQVHGTMLSNAQGNSIGAVAVLNDVTNLKRLENVQKEFVANVSHELRTPLTSIKGFIETLCDGAVNEPKEAARFLEIIKNQTERLTAIVEDLLTISRIEKEIERDEIPLEINSIASVLNAAVSLCEPKAAAKKIKLEITCPDQTISAPINRFLLEQAMINLIDNSIKFSEQNKSIFIGANSNDTFIELYVKDEGAGISKEHLPRLFERFYRVDKARSRSLGGTGLGLSIVNHIVRAHHGKVSVVSTLGKGSTFTITLPSGDFDVDT